MKVRTIVEVDLTLELAAAFFAGLDDDQQCKFFVEVARLQGHWPKDRMITNQWFEVGSHLKNCECSTEEAREIIRDMYHGLEYGKH